MLDLSNEQLLILQYFYYKSNEMSALKCDEFFGVKNDAFADLVKRGYIIVSKQGAEACDGCFSLTSEKYKIHEKGKATVQQHEHDLEEQSSQKKHNNDILIQAKASNQIAKEANSIASKANQKADDSNKISKKANWISIMAAVISTISLVLAIIPYLNCAGA